MHVAGLACLPIVTLLSGLSAFGLRWAAGLSARLGLGDTHFGSLAWSAGGQVYL